MIFRSTLLCCFAFCSSLLAAEAPPKLNVLFIAVDDLRPELACYGHAMVKSPNIDKLAATGLRFERAYCQQAVCSPTRSSLMTGRRPDSTRVYDLVTHFRTALPDVKTLPQAFREAGYHTEGMGKIYHPGFDDAPSWSTPSWYPGGKAGKQAPAKKGAEKAAAAARFPGMTLTQAPKKAAPKSGAKDVPATTVLEDNGSWMADTRVAGHAVERLAALKNGKEPFFLAVGFVKPHLPFVAPKQYWDLYDPTKITLAREKSLPKNAPALAGHDSRELRNYNDMPDTGPITDEMARHLIHGYYAATSYLDAQVGRVLDALEKEGLADKTIVILWGDHGWNLGEHGLWCKHSNYETSTRVPLLIRVPGYDKSHGQATRALTEFVDIYPTLCELCSVKPDAKIEGQSFIPLLKDPKATVKTAAFSQYPRPMPEHGPSMGYAVRTDRWRYVEWRAKKDGHTVRELYYHVNDPDETVNVADEPANAGVVKEHAELLKSIASEK
jgi:iduronate 2-sulfatase